MEVSPGVDIRHSYDWLAYSMVTYWYSLPGENSNRIPELKKINERLIPLSAIDLLEQDLKS